MNDADRVARLTERCRPQWEALAAAGWTMGPGESAGAATTNEAHRRIQVRASAWAAPSLRVRAYTIRHEVGHALNWQNGNRAPWDLAPILGCTPRAAKEALADACALEGGGLALKAYVLGAIAWHRARPAAKRIIYTWAMVRHPATRAWAAQLWAVAP